VVWTDEKGNHSATGEYKNQQREIRWNFEYGVPCDPHHIPGNDNFCWLKDSIFIKTIYFYEKVDFFLDKYGYNSIYLSLKLKFPRV
jgi:hypothetical protein